MVYTDHIPGQNKKNQHRKMSGKHQVLYIKRNVSIIEIFTLVNYMSQYYNHCSYSS